MSSTTAAEGRLRELRQKVLGTTLNVVSVAAPLLAMFLVLEGIQRHTLTSRNLGSAGFTLTFPALRAVGSRIGFRPTGAVFLGLLLTAASMLEVRGGVSMSAACLTLLVLVLSGVLFGGRGVLVGLAVALAAFVFVAVLALGRYVEPAILPLWDPRFPMTWVRAGIALALFGAAGGLSIAYIIERLEGEMVLLREAVERERKERSARERAEAEREEERRRREGAQRALETAHRLDALGRLAGGVAHDFANALTVIQSAAEYALNETTISRSVRECLTEVVDATSSAARMTRQLLTASRRDVTERTQLDVGPLLRKLESTLRRLLPEDIKVVVDVRDEAIIVVDHAQFERALLNLAMNARDAMPGGGRLEIGCRREGSSAFASTGLPAPFVAVWVKDTGTGIDEETRERIFEPFFTTKSAAVGTGLGLAVVRGFAQEAGGRIEVESQPGSGTTMTLFLPEATDPLFPMVPAATPANDHTPSVAGRAVLVVEDHPEVQRSIGRTLSAAGLHVRAVEDGTAAIKLLDDPRFACDLLCIDAVLPGTSSGRVIERALARRSPPAILVCSGYVEEDLIRRGVQTGRYALLKKPFAAGELLRRVRERLAQADSTGFGGAGH